MCTQSLMYLVAAPSRLLEFWRIEHGKIVNQRSVGIASAFQNPAPFPHPRTHVKHKAPPHQFPQNPHKTAPARQTNPPASLRPINNDRNNQLHLRRRASLQFPLQPRKLRDAASSAPTFRVSRRLDPLSPTSTATRDSRKKTEPTRHAHNLST